MEVDPEALLAFVTSYYSCQALWLSAHLVHEAVPNRSLWTGQVHMFELRGHSTAAWCYAWASTAEDGYPTIHPCLHEPPVISPSAAVRHALGE